MIKLPQGTAELRLSHNAKEVVLVTHPRDEAPQRLGNMVV